MSNPFHVGQRVVFMGHPKEGFYPEFEYPVRNKVYTIREIGPYDPRLVLLEEIRNPATFKGEPIDCEPGFHWGVFRPVVERKTDISIFTNILNTQRVRTDA